MATKVLKIDVTVDETGAARRALGDLEGGVKKVQASADPTAEAMARLNAKFAEAEKLVGAAEESVDSLTSSTANAAAEALAWNSALGLAAVAVSALAAGVYALGNFIKDSTEYYAEQSGVLDVNREAVDRLTESWETLQYVIGEKIVGGQGDFTGWIDTVNLGLMQMTAHLGAAIEFYERLARYASRPGSPAEDILGLSDSPGATPGIDTTRFNPDGSPTPYELLRRQKDRNLKGNGGPFGTIGGNDPFSAGEAERITMEEINRAKREQLDLEREQKREAADRLRLVQEHARLEQDVVTAITRARDAYEQEITAAQRLNQVKIEGLNLSMRDSMMKSMLAPGDYEDYAADAALKRNLDSIDPRAGNADELRRRYTAQRELQGIQKRQGAGGMTQDVYNDLSDFRIKYADIIGDLPTQFQAVIPSIAAASGQMRDTLTSDLYAVASAQERVIAGYGALGGSGGTTGGSTPGNDALATAYRDAGIFVGNQRPAFGAPAPAVRGHGLTITNTIDARGAQFTNEGAIDRLAQRVSQSMQATAERVAG